jgi:hypothetical protein
LEVAEFVTSAVPSLLATSTSAAILGGSSYGFSIVNAANLNVFGGGLLQFGYAVCGNLCQGFGGASAEDFWWTKYAGNPWYDEGTIVVATWVDFNGDGTHDKPQIGKSYSFSIEILAPNTPATSAEYCVTDLDGSFAGSTDCKLRTIPYWPRAGYPWWGYERQNGVSAIGHLSGSSSIQMRNMYYRTSSGLTFVTGSPQIYWYKANTGAGGTGTGYSYIGGYTTTTGGLTNFYVYTAIHY